MINSRSNDARANAATPRGVTGSQANFGSANTLTPPRLAKSAAVMKSQICPGGGPPQSQAKEKSGRAATTDVQPTVQAGCCAGGF
jgi:hypothetical protein